jgi:DNA-binding CsgD family transcriptional regulator
MYGKFSGLASDLQKIGLCASQDAIWAALKAATGRLGNLMMFVTWDRDARADLKRWVTPAYADLSAEQLKIAEQTAEAANFPLQRIVYRAAEPFLLSDIKNKVIGKKTAAWLRATQAVPSGDELFVVPANRPGNLGGIAYFIAPAIAFDSLTRAMLTVLAEASFARADALSGRRGGAKPARLSRREISCLTIAAKGESTVGIARSLGITPRTVRFHLDNAREKLGAGTRALALRKALQQGIINP